jgi:hypothetical protein
LALFFAVFYVLAKRNKGFQCFSVFSPCFDRFTVC